MDDGAYVLGALGPGERSAYERHLTSCLACRAGVAELAVLPGLLGRVDPASLGSEPPARARLPQLIETVTDLRRRQVSKLRRRLAAAVLATATVAAAVTGVLVVPLIRPAPGPALEAMQLVADYTPVAAKARTETVAGGTAIRMWCRYEDPEADPDRWAFRLVVFNRAGEWEQVGGSWMAELGDELTLTGITRWDLDALDRVELQTVEGRTLFVYDVT